MTKQKKSKVTEAEAVRKAIDARPHIIRGMSFSEQEYEEIRKSSESMTSNLLTRP